MKAGGDVYGTFDLDDVKVEGGVEVDIGDGISITVTRFGNAQFQEYWKQLSKPYRRQIDNNTIKDEDMQKLIIAALAKTVLVSWKGIKVKGKNFPYSVPNAITLMTDLTEFRDIVAEESRRFENFRSEALEEDAKN